MILMNKINLTSSNFLLNIMIDVIRSINDSMYRIFVLPKSGIKTKPAKNVPTILPMVEIAYKFPTVLPEFSSFFISI